MIALGELKIPSSLRPVVDEIVRITDSVCLSGLDEEYADLARRAVGNWRASGPRRCTQAAVPRGRPGGACAGPGQLPVRPRKRAMHDRRSA